MNSGTSIQSSKFHELLKDVPESSKQEAISITIEAAADEFGD